MQLTVQNIALSLDNNATCITQTFCPILETEDFGFDVILTDQPDLQGTCSLPVFSNTDAPLLPSSLDPAPPECGERIVVNLSDLGITVFDGQKYLDELESEDDDPCEEDDSCEDDDLSEEEGYPCEDDDPCEDEYEIPEDEYEILEDEYEVFDDEYEILEDEYEVFDDDYEILEDEYEVFDDEYEILEGDYEVFDDEYEILEGDYEVPEDDDEVEESELGLCILGTEHDDTIIGTSKSDVIMGFGGICTLLCVTTCCLQCTKFGSIRSV